MSDSHAHPRSRRAHHIDFADASSYPTLAFVPEEDDADYIGMTGKSGKLRAKGHLSASVVYILRRFYAAWRVAKKRRTYVTFRSPGAKVLGARIRDRYGTDWGLNDDELEVAFLSTVEAVNISHRRSCRIASEVHYVSWLDCVSGTPLPRTVGLNGTTGLDNELSRYQGRQRAKAAAVQPAPGQQTLNSLWAAPAQQSSSVAAPTVTPAVVVGFPV